MRRLPVFLLLDVSESMAGPNHRCMEDSLETLIKVLRTDPHALETVHLCAIAFAGICKTLVPLTETFSFQPPRLPIGGGTAMGAALEHLMAEIDRSVIFSSSTRKADWKPIIFFFTDGKPTDATRSAVDRWRSDYSKKAQLVAIGIGPFADLSTLRKLTDKVLVLEKTTEEHFKELVRWVSSTVRAHSQSVGTHGDDLVLPPIDPRSLHKIESESAARNAMVDGDCVVLIGRCQQETNPYLIKYDRMKTSSMFGAFSKAAVDVDALKYEVSGCYKLEEDYFAWSQPGERPMIRSEGLVGAPACPWCGNGSAFGVCACGGILCTDGPGEATCPWCKNKLSFRVSEDDFSVRRGQG